MKENAIRCRARPPARRRRSGVTLIELLVVVCVILILASLAFPVLSAIQHRRNQAVCVANLRQQGALFQLYAQDNNQHLPPAYGGSPTPVSWMIAMQYLMNPGVPANLIRIPALGEKNVYLCPEALVTYPHGQARRSYAINEAGRGEPDAVMINSLTHPATTVLVMDSVYASGGDGARSFGLDNWTTVVDWRHQNGVEGLFVDGHVEWFPRSATATLNTYVQNYAPAAQ